MPQHVVELGHMSMRIGKLVGRAVREQRERLGLSQEAVARRAKMDRAYLSNLEGGSRNPSVEVVERLAKALDTTPGQLLDTAEGFRKKDE